ncbi:prmC [Symbiodinium sp. CCMP2592]|nr:prmC [Symbiodinium sp. CCMP2592]
MVASCVSCLSIGSRKAPRERSDSIDSPREAAKQVRLPADMSDRSVRKKPASKGSSPGSSTHSGSTTQDRELISTEYDFATFPATVQVRNLPIVVFDDDVEEQMVWDSGVVKDGVVQHAPGPPDVRVKNPVVMSNAYRGFVVQPHEVRYLHYRDVGIIFARPLGGRFMQPSIDTILVCRALVDCLAEMKQVKRVIDVGSGSGLIGKFAAHYAQGDGDLEVTLVDIDPVAFKYYQSNTFNAQNVVGAAGRSIDWKFRAEDAVALLNDDAAFDLVVSNPPYIPTKGEATSSSLSPLSGGFWEGVGLVAYLLKLISERPAGPARLVMMISSLTLKSPAIINALEAAEKRGCKLRVLLEREIGWKAWYAGPAALDHLLASPKELRDRRKVAGCKFFIGATAPGNSRTGLDGRDDLWGYHWHFAYVLEVQAPRC